MTLMIAAPMDVYLYKNTIRQSDIIFISNEHKERINDECLGIPDLVIEILSENSIDEDRICKFKQYEKAGIQEYWIVDPFKQIIEVFVLENGAYALFGKSGIGEMAYSKLLAGFQVSGNSIFE